MLFTSNALLFGKSDAVLLYIMCLMSLLLNMLGSLSKSHTTVIFINQLRSKIGVMYGNPEVRYPFFSEVVLLAQGKRFIESLFGLIIESSALYVIIHFFYVMLTGDGGRKRAQILFVCAC